MHRVLVAIGVVIGLASPAAAERAALFLGSTAKGVDRPALIKIARAQAEAAGWSVTEPPLADGPLGDLLMCVSSGLARDCIPGHLDDNDVDRGIVISVGQEGKKGSWVLNGWVFRRTGDLIVTDRTYCEGCSAEKLGDAVRDLTSTLITEAHARAKPTVILARSKPSGAKVFVDDSEVGVAELEAPVYAGTHNVRFEMEGYKTEIREVAIGDGESVTVEVKLTAVEAAPVKVAPGPKAPSKVLPLSLIGGGVALLVAGGIVLAMDEDAIQGGERVPEYTDTVAPSVALFAGGAIAAAMGVVLYVRAKPEAETRQPIVGVTPDGFWLGLAGAF